MKKQLKFVRHRTLTFVNRKQPPKLSRAIFHWRADRVFPILLNCILLVICTQSFSRSSFAVVGISMDESGPRLIEEWPPVYSFSSGVGGKLQCKVAGQPKPQVQWLTKDFFPLNNLTAVREVDEERNLIFKPFEWQNFRPDVHASSFRCRATNNVGTIISAQINTRPVLDIPFEIENNDVIVLRGNIAVLRCSVPDDIKDFVTVTSWVQDATINIYPNFQTGKYLLLPNGDLYVFNVDASDGYKTFACRTSSKLTNHAKISQNSRIIVRDAESVEGIQLGVRKELTIKVNAGEDVYLPCAAQGNPPPIYSWFRERDGILSDLSLKSRKRPVMGSGNGGSGFSPQDGGPILLTQVRPEDTGSYVCRLNNSISHYDVRISLNVYVPLRVQLSPNSQVVDVGRSANFRCLVSGSPIESITWFKNGVLIRHDSASIIRYKISPRETLIVNSVEAEDAGMYQCFASNDLYSAQDSAQLRLGSVLPELTYRFTEQTLQAGPSVSLKCTAIGNPPPQFQWTLDGFAIPENERFLVGQYVTVHDSVISHVNITNVHSEDSGLYSCQAKNVMGSVAHSARLNIYGPPFIRLIPPIKAVSGKKLQISCPVSGFPIEQITWERGGSLLPGNRQQRVYPNGTLIIENIQKGSDEGIYTCHAKNRVGLTSTRDLHIQVVVPPKIMPFQFLSEYLREGRRLAVSCQILEGDKPLEFTWQFQGKPISSSTASGLTVRIPDEYSTTLVIDSLTSAHNGQYTCVAENSAGKELHSAVLTVNVPPKWTLEPRDINVSAGQLITLQCQADGHPTPSITWKRASNSQPGEYKDLSGKTTNIFENGTIRFEEIRKADEGQYLCEAKNGVGSGLSKVVFVKVNAPAEFAERDEEISVKAGDKAILQCRARGDLPIEIQWSNKHTKITSASHSTSRYAVRRQDLEMGVLSELLISGAGRADGGVYYCRATNPFGSDQTTVILKVQEPPEQPGNLRLIEEQSRSIQISWSESFNGNSPLINFIIQYKFPSETWTEAEVEELAVPATQTLAIIPNLSPSTTYHLRVLAQNSMGYSRPSEIIQVTTTEEAPESPPQDIHIEPLTSTKLRVRWSPPEKHLWHGNILGYYLGYREIGLALLTTPSASGSLSGESSAGIYTSSLPTGASSDLHGYHFKTVEVGMGFGGMATLDNLKKYTRYAVVVQTFNSKGAGPISSPVVGTTDQDVPTQPPEKIACGSTSSQSIQVTWDDPSIEGRHGVIQGYKVMHQVSDPMEDANDSNSDTESEELPVETKMTTSKATSLHELRRWTNYSVSVLAFTAMGDGKVSQAIMCQTEEDVPSAPAGIKAVVSSRRSILLSWLPPQNPNGRLEKYTLYMKFMESSKIDKRTLEGTERSYEAIGLKEGQSYEFWLTASTRVGEGGETPRVQISPANKVPAKIASFSRTIKVPWKRDVILRCDSVGIPEPAIVWKLNGKNYADSSFTNSEQVKVGSGVETLKLSLLTSEHSGNYTCSVTNTLGSDSIWYDVRVQVPPQSPLLNIMEAFYDSLRLSWSLADNGGSRIKGYVINYKREEGDWEEYKLGSGANNHILGGLICGSKYQVFITAFNKIGTGKPSEILHGKTKGTTPAIPRRDDVISGNSSSISINLEAWRDYNCPIFRFVIEYKASNENNWKMMAADLMGDTKSYHVHSLQPSTKYDIQVTATSNAGHSVGNYSFLTGPGHFGLLSGNLPDSEVFDDSSSSSHQMNTSLLIVFPSILSLIAITGVIGVLCYFRRKRLGGGPKTVIGDSPGGLQMLMESQNQRNREQHYCVVKSTDPSIIHNDPVRYKTIDSADYVDDICPYATFQLPDKAPGRPLLTKGLGGMMVGVGGGGIGGGGGGLVGGGATSGFIGGTSKKFGRHTGDTMYNVGNIYSGPYHSVQSPGFIYNQATLPLRDTDYERKVERKVMESNESDNVGSTDSEVKKILTLHLPISEYDTLGSDSEGEKRHGSSSPIHHPPQRILPGSNVIPIQHEMVTFRQRQRSDPVITSDHSSTSSDSSPTSGVRKKSYFSRKSKSKSSVQSGSSSMKQRVRSSSGYSSHTEETSFRIQPPTRFSDSRDLSDGDEHEMTKMGEQTAGITAATDQQRLPINFGSMKRAHNKGRQQPSGMTHSQRKGPTYHIDV